ncbi:hypothetical protein RKD23_003525 [Streptomyces sp. SAI-170]|uniref:NB-ARC domain-containing protein n=1 Tax=Streptomyces sp. SAI-170 TaxID=3377729 RepID=UPI003C7A1EC7
MSEGPIEASGERSIVAAHSIRQALTGDGAVAYYTEKALTLPSEALALPDAPPGMVNLPERTALFVGRERELSWLDDEFETAVGVVVQAVHGLGGIGKSTLAARWAAARTSSYSLVWWITAETPVDLESGLANLAIALQPALRDALSQEALSELAVKWLSSHGDWLLVLDNVSEPAHVKPLVGRTTGGRFLITTRRATGWHGIAEPLSLDLLAPGEAVELFRRIHTGQGDGVEELCAELGYLPLAVEQAAAYCTEAHITPRAYLELLASRPEQVLAGAAEGGDSERTIARVWQVTMERLANTPLTRKILGVIAWWAPDGISRDWLMPLGDEHEVTDALRRLAAHSMITLRDDGTIGVHRLVQVVSRDPQMYDTAALVLCGRAGFVNNPEWITHAEATFEHAREEAASEGTVLLVMGIGFWYGAHLSQDRATALFELAMTLAERGLGARHKTTLHSRLIFASRCGEDGDFERALSLLGKNLTMARRVHGRRSELTFDTRTALVQVLLAHGRLRDGLSVAKKNARRAERILGVGHPASLRAVDALVSGWQRLAASDPDRYVAKAATEIEGQLARLGHVVDTSDPVAVGLMWEVGRVKEAAGDIEGAIRAAEDYLRRYSALPAHIEGEALLVRYDIVRMYTKCGDLTRARELAQPLLNDVERVFGDTPSGLRLCEGLTSVIASDSNN